MPVLKIGRDELERLVPHTGGMCLLDGVLAWDDASLTCISNSHRASNNPLRTHGRLVSVHALEYGAQAVAVHGGLLAHHRSAATGGGYLAALRQAVLHVAHLDDLESPLKVHAEQLLADERHLVYRFTVSAGDIQVAEARATVIGQRRKEGT
jgi:predicted hotdog family 3-hydroxylacyl-ACP dehydratase